MYSDDGIGYCADLVFQDLCFLDHYQWGVGSEKFIVVRIHNNYYYVCFDALPWLTAKDPIW